MSPCAREPRGHAVNFAASLEALRRVGRRATGRRSMARRAYQLVNQLTEQIRFYMYIVYTVTLNYGDAVPSSIVEPIPLQSDIVDWIVEGMASEGFPSANVTCTRQ